MYDLATNLPKEKFEILVAAGGNGPLFEKLREAGIRTISISGLERDIHIIKEIKIFWQLFKILEREKPNILHLNSSKVGGIGSVASFLYKIRNTLHSVPHTPYPHVIFTVHGWGFKEDRPWLIRGAYWIFSWLSSLFQDKIVVINTADYISALRFIPSRKLALIFNGISALEFLPRDEARQFLSQKSGYALTSNTKLVGTISELTKNKGLPYFISALAMRNINNDHQDFASIIIGDGEEREILEHQIALAGFIPNAYRYLSAFDAFILPSTKEGLPYVIMEAMAAGIPVIASNVGGIPDLIDHEENGLLVPPKNSKELAKAIRELTENKLLAEQLSQNAAQKIKIKFSLETMIKKTMELYLAL